MWNAVRAPSFVTTLAGHGVAGLVFFLSFRSSLRSVWLPQFFILLVVATALLLFVLLCRRNAYRIIALLAVMLIEIVLGIPRAATWLSRPSSAAFSSSSR
jgi:hypothetical protein